MRPVADLGVSLAKWSAATVTEVIKDTLSNMPQCFSLFSSYVLHIHQLYLVCNPSRLVLQYFLYHVTLCVSAVFAVVGQPRLSVRPFVCHVRVLYPDG